MTIRVVTSLQRGFILSLMLGAIAACQPATNSGESVVTEPTSDAATEQPAASDKATGTTGAATAQGTTSSKPTATAQTQAPEPQPLPPLPAECNNPETQTAMNICAQGEYEQADVELNNTYQAVKASLSSAKADQLITAEEAWLTYRDRYCDYVAAQYAGGSMEPLVYSGCLTRLTQDRTAVLAQTAPTPQGYGAADQELNAVYQDLQEALSPDAQEQLTDAQLAWLDYRDAHCAFATGDPNTCLAQLTTLQTQRLKDQLEQRSL